MEYLAALFARYRLPLACCVLAYTGVCLYGITRLTFDDDPLKLLRSDEVEFKWLDREFAHLERAAPIVVEGENLLTPEGIEGIRRIARGAAEVKGVRAVYSLLNVPGDRRVGSYLLPLFPSSSKDYPARFARACSRARSHPLLIGHLLSEDLKTSLIIVAFDDELAGISEYKAVLNQLQAVIDRSTEASSLRARITGGTALELEVKESMGRDINVLTSMGAGLVIVIAIVLFRRMGAALLVAAGPAVGGLWTVGTLGLIGEPINMLTNVVPVLVLIIGFTDSMHLVLHARRALAEGASSLEAAQSSIRQLGLACALTSLSTAVGFGSLLVAKLFVIQRFGVCCALGSILSFFAVITVVPLLTSTRLSKYVVVAQKSTGRSRLSSLAEGILTGLLDHRRLVLVCGSVLTLILALLVIRLEPDHSIAAAIPHSSEAYQALEHVDRAFGGVMFAYALVEWPEGHGLRSQELYDLLREVHAVFDKNPVLSNPLSILNLVQSLPGEDEGLARRASQLRYIPEKVRSRFVSARQRRAVVSVHVPDAGARQLKPAFAEVDRRFAELARRYPEFHVELTGAEVTFSRAVHLMIEDLWKSLLTAAGVMFVMIWVGLRSLRYALVSLMPNVLPLLCAGTFIVLSGRYLEMSSVIVFSISLGIAVDDTIHFLVRFKREMRSGADAFQAVRRTFQIVGTALVMTTVALAAGHGIVMFSAFPAVRTFGTVSAVSITAALLGDLVILPAILVSLKWTGNRSAET